MKIGDMVKIKNTWDCPSRLNHLKGNSFIIEDVLVPEKAEFTVTIDKKEKGFEDDFIFGVLVPFDCLELCT